MASLVAVLLLLQPTDEDRELCRELNDRFLKLKPFRATYLLSWPIEALGRQFPRLVLHVDLARRVMLTGGAETADAAPLWLMYADGWD